MGLIAALRVFNIIIPTNKPHVRATRRSEEAAGACVFIVTIEDVNTLISH